MRKIIAITLSGWSLASFGAEAVDTAPSGGLIQITLSLLLVVGLLVGFSVLFRKFGMNRFTSPLPLKVVGAVSIGNNQRLVVVEIGDEWIVLGVTPQQISTITSMPRQESAGSDNGANAKANFSAWMQGALDKYHAKKP